MHHEAPLNASSFIISKAILIYSHINSAYYEAWHIIYLITPLKI